MYTGHTQYTSVARISPSGYYCASGDIAGNVRVWDIVGEENVLKIEKKVFAGSIKDLAWDAESTRIGAVGDGRGGFGSYFMLDTGATAGEISGHSKVINAISMNSGRPFRAVTASDDNTLVFYHGAPYKYEKSIKTHTRFVQDARFSPSGELLVSVGSDSKVFLYDGKTGDVKADLGEGLHSGTIFAVTWSPDSQLFATSSADRTVKLFDASTQKAVSSWNVGAGIQDQQCGNAWVGENEIASLSLNGDINVFDKRTEGKAARVLYGPNKGVTAAAVDASGTFFAGSYDGRIMALTTNGTVEAVAGSGHSNHVSGISVAGGKMCSVAYDDTYREFTGGKFDTASLSTSGQPKGVAGTNDGIVFVVSAAGIDAVKEGRKVSNLKVAYSPSAVAVHGTKVAVGSEDTNIYLYDWDGSKLTPDGGKLESNKGALSAMAFSPDGTLLAAGDSSGGIMLYDVSQMKLVTSRWSSHTAKINALAFHPGGAHVVSGSLDTNIYIWSVKSPLRRVLIPNAGMGGVNAVQWIGGGGNTVASAGADASIRTWEIVLPG